MALITCQNLSLGYDGKAVLQNLSFSVHAGEYLCIIGENGTGKTTLMKTLLQLQKPLAGSIQFGDDLRPSRIGYLPQQKQIQRDFPASVLEIVRSGCLNHCGFRPFFTRKERMLSQLNLQKMHISHLTKCCYRELSGGQQQRVLLARALCATSQLLFLDEPVSGLDPQAAKELYQEIYELYQNQGITVIMITHDISAAFTYATHILKIGKSVFFGTKDAYLQSNAEKQYLSEEVKSNAG